MLLSVLLELASFIAPFIAAALLWMLFESVVEEL
jgi:hypothetical protein